MTGQGAGKVLAWTTRGSVVETRHTAHVVAAIGAEVASVVGDGQILNPLRSTGKPFILGALLRQCGAEISDEEVALFASSHNGEAYHTRTLRQSLQRRGLADAALRLGRQDPIVPNLDLDVPLVDGKLAEALQNNCSGKHVGMMVLAQHLGQAVTTYGDPDGRAIELAFSQFEDLARPYGSPFIRITDGCGIQTVALRLMALTQLYALMVSQDAPTELARVARAYWRYPYAVGGARRASTAMLRLGLIAKEGFEGLFLLAFLRGDYPVAIAIKVDSGSDPVAEAIAMRLAEAITGRFLPSDIYPGSGLHDQLGNPTGSIHVDDEFVADIVDRLPSA